MAAKKKEPMKFMGSFFTIGIMKRTSEMPFIVLMVYSLTNTPGLVGCGTCSG